jgi:orotidine-5'-phosphate decarboxylase
VAAAEAMVARLGDAVSFYKIGYQLAFAGGLSFAEGLARSGRQVFLDLKLHDIGNTVAKGVDSVARLGVTFLTVHAYPQTMKAAVEARGQSGSSTLRILAVTVLTSYDDADLAAAGYDFTVAELVAERAAQARDIGVDGLVCSAEEAAALRPLVGRGMALVTPGIRPAGADSGDQKRIMTPAAAIAAGADYLVVGRPVVAAADPKAAAQAIIAEIAGAA